MAKNSSSALWLRGHLSRAKGAAARRADQIAHIEVRIAFHRHHLQVHERDLERAKLELAEFLESAQDFEAAIELHESSASAGSAPTVGPHEAVAKYYGLGNKVLRELRAGSLAVRDLRAALAERLKVRPEDAGIFRHRLNVVLNNLLYRHVLLSSGDFWTQDRRWEINPDYRPKPREKRSKDRVTYHVIEVLLEGFDTCFFSLGVSAGGMDDAMYAHLTQDLTRTAAKTLSRLDPRMTYVYNSGAGTDTSEHGRVIWARVTGRTVMRSSE